MRHGLRLATTLLALLPAVARGQDLERLFASGDSLSHDGYTVTRTFELAPGETRYGTSRTVVRRGRRVLARLEGGIHREATRFFLFPLLGGRGRQLVVETYSGGAHCCYEYHVFDLGPRFRKLFDGGAYSADEVGYEMKLIDVDGDGVYEFAQNVMSFDYFYVSHASSVFPELVFAYDRRRGAYRPANRAHARYLLRDITRKESAAAELNARLEREGYARREGGGRDFQFEEKYFNAVVGVVLDYIYAGREAEGWAYFDKNYRLPNKPQLRRDMRGKLSESVIYKSIYSRGS